MSPTDDVILSPHAQILLRGDGAVQFGLDATRAGIIESPVAEDIAAALELLTRPTDLDRLLDRLVAAGLDEPDAVCLLEELLIHGVIRPTRRLPVLLVGASDLARALAQMLHGSGFSVRTTLPDENVELLLHGVDRAWSILLVDQLATPPRLAAVLRRLPNVTVSTTIVDRRGLIGPVRVGGRGPCPLCVDLHWVKQDAHFHTVASQARDTGAAARQDPVVTGATAAATTALLQALRGHRVSGSLDPVEPGDCLVVDPYAPTRAHRFRLDPFVGCPVCF